MNSDILKQSDTEGSINYSIESIRFISSLLIVFFHILHSNILPYVAENSFYYSIKKSTDWAGLFAELFLIISGYYTYRSAQKQSSFLPTVIRRFARLWPVLAFYTIIMVVFFNLSSESALSYLLLIHATGLSPSYTGIIWYIPPFFWSSLFIIGIRKTFNNKATNLLLSITTYLGYAININSFNGGLGRETILVFISSALLRVLSGMSLGYLVGAVDDEIKKQSLSIKHSRSSFILFSVLETLISSILFYKLLINHGKWTSRITIIILMALLIFSFVNQYGILSKILNNKVVGRLGKYSYSIYVMQQISFYLLGKTFWRNTDFVNTHIVFTLMISILISTIIGILTYYIIEKPAIKLCDKFLRD